MVVCSPLLSGWKKQLSRNQLLPISQTSSHVKESESDLCSSWLAQCDELNAAFNQRLYFPQPFNIRLQFLSKINLWKLTFLHVPCRSLAIDFPSGTDGTILDVAKKWMFSVFRNSFLERPAIDIEKLSKQFHFLVVFPLVSSLKTNKGTVAVCWIPWVSTLSVCGSRNFFASCEKDKATICKSGKVDSHV